MFTTNLITGIMQPGTDLASVPGHRLVILRLYTASQAPRYRDDVTRSPLLKTISMEYYI